MTTSRVAEASIPDIDVTRLDKLDPDCDVHYGTFEHLAEVFGRNTPAHRHSRVFQIHLLMRGGIHLQLDDEVYVGEAPLVFMTPPAIPHAFYSDEDTVGHVISIRQELVRSWRASLPGQWPESLLREPAFLPLTGLPADMATEAERLMRFAVLLQDEFAECRKGRPVAASALGLCFFISLARLLAAGAPVAPLKRERSEDLRIFLKFCDLVEGRFRDHLTLPAYARELAVTEARLNDVCRRVANLSSKEVVHERLLQEARRLLRFSSTPVSELSYQLGFADPAYFSRFFTRRTGTTPSLFRATHQGRTG